MERWTGITWNRGPAWRGTLDRHAWNTHTALALLLVAFCWGVGGAWLAVPAAGLAIWALRKRSDARGLPSERAEELRRVRERLDKDMRDPSGIAPASAWFDPRLRP